MTESAAVNCRECGKKTAVVYTRHNRSDTRRRRRCDDCDLEFTMAELRLLDLQRSYTEIPVTAWREFLELYGVHLDNDEILVKDGRRSQFERD